MQIMQESEGKIVGMCWRGHEGLGMAQVLHCTWGMLVNLDANVAMWVNDGRCLRSLLIMSAFSVKSRSSVVRGGEKIVSSHFFEVFCL